MDGQGENFRTPSGNFNRTGKERTKAMSVAELWKMRKDKKSKNGRG